MSNPVISERFTSRSHRVTHLIGYVLIFSVALRRIRELDNTFAIALALFLITIFTALYASENRLSQRFKSYPRLYFALQMVITQLLGMFQVYLDTWALLYIALGFQVVVRCSRKEALVWGSLFIASTLVTLCAEFGLISGPGRALAYIVIGIFLISFDVQVAHYEDALDESQVLLAELQSAHQKLKAYASQADKLAAAQERDRMIQELHDSAGQKIFDIQLAVEATGQALENDPGRVGDYLAALQVQTQSALTQMRQLISQWRPT
jgi:signal transduction histidine kinase